MRSYNTNFKNSKLTGSVKIVDAAGKFLCVPNWELGWRQTVSLPRASYFVVFSQLALIGWNFVYTTKITLHPVANDKLFETRHATVRISFGRTYVSWCPIHRNKTSFTKRFFQFVDYPLQSFWEDKLLTYFGQTGFTF